MSRQHPTPEAAFGRLVTATTAYGLHLAVDMIADRVGRLLASADEPLSPSELRRLKLARAALRSAKTHFARLFSPADDEPDDRRDERREAVRKRLAKLHASRHVQVCPQSPKGSLGSEKPAPGEEAI